MIPRSGRAAAARGIYWRVPSTLAATERFTADEKRLLDPCFGNTDSPVFALTNLPEAVKGALFARYSRSAKSARRLFLDEFLDDLQAAAPGAGQGPGGKRAERLYAKVFNEYGDDSVAQLGGAHVACEGVSNVLTKVLERGRLMSYLEQSTRYVPYTQRPGGRWKYVVPGEIDDPQDRAQYVATLDRAFETYARWIEPLQAHYRRQFPRAAGDSAGAHRAAIRAKALDALRGLLPAATRSNVGIYGSGQAYEALLLRMRAHPLAESREVAQLMLGELRKVIPAFVQRVDREDRGVAWSRYLEARNRRGRAVASGADPEIEWRRYLDAGQPGGDAAGTEVALTEFDPDGEARVVAALLYPGSGLPHGRLLAAARAMPAATRGAIIRAGAGDRSNRRQRPGRAFEQTAYTFDVLSDYGAFRDLQRHRMLTIEWQDLTARHGCAPPEPAIEAAGALADWKRVLAESAALHERLAQRYSATVAQYAVSMAYRIRFQMRMNAREAMHVIELRTSPQGHPSYRRVCRRMHELIADEAGHVAIAGAMRFLGSADVDLERLAAEQASERKRLAQPPAGGQGTAR